MEYRRETALATSRRSYQRVPVQRQTHDMYSMIVVSGSPGCVNGGDVFEHKLSDSKCVTFAMTFTAVAGSADTIVNMDCTQWQCKETCGSGYEGACIEDAKRMFRATPLCGWWMVMVYLVAKDLPVNVCALESILSLLYVVFNIYHMDCTQWQCREACDSNNSVADATSSHVTDTAYATCRTHVVTYQNRCTSRCQRNVHVIQDVKSSWS